MRALRKRAAILLGLLPVLSASGAFAAEGGFSDYGLGGAAFNAGITPPAGTYVTGVAGFYTGTMGGSTSVGGVRVRAGAKVDFLQLGVNALIIPDAKLLGGQLGLSLTLPAGFVDLGASLSAGGPGIRREVSGVGLGDITPKLQLGWESGTFFDTMYVQATLPTGTYQPGFNPNIGLHRPAIDVGNAITWIDPGSKIQIDASAGVTFNFENTATNYQSGTEAHLDWAVGKDIGNGFTLGVVGYDYRQLTGDSGAGATLGAYKGSVDAVGLGLGYSSKVGNTPVSLALRHYQEFNVSNRFAGNSTIATMTFAF